MRAYQRKVQLLSTNGTHLRWLPSGVAKAMVEAEHATVASANGSVKAIKLVQCAQTSALRTGEPMRPTGPTAVRFTRREKLDGGGAVWQFHRRSFEQ